MNRNGTLLRLEGFRHGSFSYHENDGFFYHFNKSTPQVVYFRCRKWRTCPGKATFTWSQGFSCTHPHNHPPNLQEVSIAAERRHLIDEARAFNYVTFADIYQRNPGLNHLEDLSLTRLGPSLMRAQLSEISPQPLNLRDLTSVLQNERYAFLTAIGDSGESLYQRSGDAEDGSHVILLASERCKAFMKMVPSVLGSNVTLCIPGWQHSLQVHCISSVWEDSFVPLAWCIMEQKSLTAFMYCLLLLRAYLKIWNFATAICADDEVENVSYEKVFGVKVCSSVYHHICDIVDFTQSSLRNDTILSEPSARDLIGLCCSLPLIPEEFRSAGFGVIHDVAGTVPDADVRNFIHSLLSYLHVKCRNQRHCSFSVTGSAARTSDAGFRICWKFHLILDKPTTNFVSMFRFLKRAEAASYRDILCINLGKRAQKSRAESLCFDPAIRRLTRELANPPFSPEVTVRNLLKISKNRCKRENFTRMIKIRWLDRKFETFVGVRQSPTRPANPC